MGFTPLHIKNADKDGVYECQMQHLPRTFKV